MYMMGGFACAAVGFALVLDRKHFLAGLALMVLGGSLVYAELKPSI